MKVLIVEDNLKVSRLLVRVFGEEGFTVDACAHGEDAVTRATAVGHDVIVLDWMLPDIDGIAVCTQLRRAGITTPILMLTARDEVNERVLGLNSGADDYLVKPFEVEELLARVRALLRRTSSMARFRAGALEIDPMARRAFVAGAPVDLTTREYSLLVYLARRVDVVVPRTELLANVWETNFEPGTNIVEVSVSRLRDKLGDHDWMVETVRGAGYRLRVKSPE